jgi:hypothetical protein
MEEEVRTIDAEVGTKPLVVVHVEITKTVVGQLKA